MASTYPGGLDSFDTIAADKKTSDAVGGRTHRAMHNDLGDAIEAVQGELGTTPSGSESTVAARLDKIEDGTRLAANSVGATQLADSAVDTAAIADSAVTSAKIANDTIVDADVNSAANIATSKIAGNPIPRTLIDAKGDLLVGTGNDAVGRLAAGADGTMIGYDSTQESGLGVFRIGNLLTANQAGGYSGWGSDGTLDYWGGGEFAVTSPWSYVFSSDRYPVTPGDVVTIQAELQPVGADSYVVTQFFTALSGGSAVGAERPGTIVASGGNALSSLTTVVPATAVAMAFLIYGGTATLHVRHPGIWRGAGGQWAMPGVPITDTGIRPNPSNTSEVQIWNDATATWITV